MSSPPVLTQGVHTLASVTKVTLETALNALITQVSKIAMFSQCTLRTCGSPLRDD